MITVSADFITSAKSATKQIKARIVNGDDTIAESDDLKKVKYTASGELLRASMRQIEFEVFGSHNLLGNNVFFEYGLVLPDTSVEYINLGLFKVTEVETDKATGVTRAKGFDLMYDALIPYVSTATFPISLTDFLDDLCDQLGWTLATSSFPNDDLSLTEDIFEGLGMSYRDVLDDIAEATGSFIFFNHENELVVRQISEDVDDSLTADNLISLELNNKYGEVNSVVLSRMPQEDNIAQQDTGSISEYGLTEIKIVNNLPTDSDRETYIADIFTALDGIEYYPATYKTEGLGYYEIGDRIEVEDLAENTYETIVNEIILEVTGGVNEQIKSFIPTLTSTPYQYAGIIGQTIKNTEIIVNKQEGYIESLVSSVDGLSTSVALNSSEITSIASRVDVTESDINSLEDDVTTLTQTADALTLQVEGMGGSNLILNSVGLKGSLTEWQLFDEEGALIDSDNDGTIIQTSEIKENSESGSAIQITDEQYLEQTFNTIIGETYTLYFRYKQTDNCYVYISAISEIELTGDADEWTVFKYDFVATEGTTTLRYRSVASETITITDTVVKKGGCTGWQQAPNEVYGSNFRFDKDGFSITSQTDTFKSTLDNTSLSVYDTAGGTDRVMMVVSKDEGKITQFTAQEQLTVQRYDNSASALRIIPTDTGAMFVIND